MTSYKIVCMETFTERLIWAMKCAGYNPAKDQSRLAAEIGKPCKPQNIQHLLDPDNQVEHTKYILDIAAVLNCDPFWLGRNKGTKPVMGTTEATAAPYKYTSRVDNVAVFAATPVAPHFMWPFKSFSIEQFNSLDDKLKENFEAIILASIGNRGHPEKQNDPATNQATG